MRITIVILAVCVALLAGLAVYQYSYNRAVMDLSKGVMDLVEDHFSTDHMMLDAVLSQDSLIVFDNLGQHDCCPEHATEKITRSTT